MTTENSVNFYTLNKKYKKENDMGYIIWPQFDIPESFEQIFTFLPKQNIPSEKINRKTQYDKLLDMFELNNEDGETITITEISNSDIKLPISDKLKVQFDTVDKLIQTKKIVDNGNDNTTIIKPKKTKKVVDNENDIKHDTNLELEMKPKRKSNKTKSNSIPDRIKAELEI